MGDWISSPNDVSLNSALNQMVFWHRMVNVNLSISVTPWYPSVISDDSLNKIHLIIVNCGHNSPNARQNEDHLLSFLTKQIIVFRYQSQKLIWLRSWVANIYY